MKLNRCGGDCDTDSDCLNNMACWQRSAGEPLPPGCKGSLNSNYDYCYRRQIDNVGANPGHQLSWCQGDCDHDSDCAGGLFCWQRNDGDANPPGCFGNTVRNWDYCYRPSGDARIESIAVNPQRALPNCAGDCDNDDGCAGNLVCFQREINDQVPPGCRNTAKDDWDYCFDSVILSDFRKLYIYEIFIIMTHNSLALPGQVGSPNQNHDLAEQFRNGVRGFNLDLYMVDGEVKTKHGSSQAYNPSNVVQELMDELEKTENAGEFIIIQLQTEDDLDLDIVSNWFGSKLVKRFSISRKLGWYLGYGQQVLVLTDKSHDDTIGIHDTNQFIVENDYAWNQAGYAWIEPWNLITQAGSANLENMSPPMGYRRGPTTGKRISLMNYFCCDGSGNMIKSHRVHEKSVVKSNIGLYKSEDYTGGKINILMVDYYEVRDYGIFDVQTDMRKGEYWG